jgi:hypothetical protein
VDAFVAKLNSNGILQWNTFMGSIDYDRALDIAVDGQGSVYVVGESSNIGWGMPVNAFSGNTDVFAVKLDNNGFLQWNTFMGSSVGWEEGLGIATNNDGFLYMTGYSAANWGTPVNAHTDGENDDVFVVKLKSIPPKMPMGHRMIPAILINILDKQ